MSNIDKQALRTVAMLAKELSGISMYSKAIAAINKFHELFTPDVALALLDELESKQTFQQAFFRQSLMYDVVAEAYEEAKEQIAKDVEIKARLCTESNSLFDRLRAAEKRIAELREWNAGLAQESFERQQRIAELEARAVTLEPFRSFVTDADITALHRFAECCDDPESGGHDLEKEQVRRLEAIGALQRSGRISYITDFGDVLISITAGIGIKGESNNG
ncbi:ead/Ea22-like family protein [Citrobacter koseri]|uniref:ead/Ea22-like family protein n=1 Tax=Citrobacter koseri TaxID=545 RepID=UPI00192C4B62|nr:ead/Ea22-like family protein [Citrobacter koseri]MBL4565669.1 hypothetical protein [Citrobacter koseri]